VANKRSLLLNDNWDIGITSSGELATVSGPYCDAQNVANAIRLFTNDAYLNTQKGVPHFNLDLGVEPSMSAVRSVYRKTARAVDNIRNVNVNNIFRKQRSIAGFLTVENETGTTINIEL
jgi:hypothetical protein